MTKSRPEGPEGPEGGGAVAGVPRCRWCGRPLADARGPGRPRLYCRRSCRQRDYEARRRAAELGLSETEVILTRAELEALGDHLYVLEAAIEDVEGDLARSAEPDDYHAALAWVLEAAKPLVGLGRRRRPG